MQPEKLGRYKILKELGRGGMGCVYLAHDPEIDRQVAIKTVHVFADIPPAEATESRERFMREARSAGKLLHPGIVTLFDVGEEADVPYLAMEYVQGSTLEAFCRADGLLPVKKVGEMLAGVAQALDYAHRAGIIHRDIKPANLMLVGDTVVKIMDFGLAKPPETQLTQDGKLLGTPSYMSPEQICGRTIDGRTDLFSLGVVLFEMLTGQRPFPGDSISSVIYRIVNEDPRDATAVHTRVPGSLDKFLRRALAKEPKERFASGGEFAYALREAVGTLGGDTAEVGLETEQPATTPDVSESSLPPPPTRPPRSSAVPWVLTVASLAALGGAGWFFRDQLGFVTQKKEVAAVVWETQVSTVPPGLEVLLDGEPLDPASGGLVRFGKDGPFGLLSAKLECRTAEHQISAADAGGEVQLVLDPVEMSWLADLGVAGTAVKLNGKAVGEAPTEVPLNLCRKNELEFRAAGFRNLSVEIAKDVTPLQARTQLAALTLEAIPKGRLAFPDAKVSLVYYLDGKRLGGDPGEVELLEGRHELRVKNDALWIDVRQTVNVKGGETLRPKLRLPQTTTLVVQTYPPACKIHLRRPGATKWKYIDEAPASKKIAVGEYELRVEHPSGMTREQKVVLEAGNNPPVRVTFASSS